MLILKESDVPTIFIYKDKKMEHQPESIAIDELFLLKA